MARIAIVGVGAIGGAVAGLLEMAGGHEIILCTRRPLGQLTVTMPTGPVHVKARNVSLPDAAGPVDWVMVATKAYDAEGAAEWLPTLCAGGAPPDAVNSLFADRLAGRRMETDARNGAIVREGEEHGIPTPLNRMAVTLLDAQQPGRPLLSTRGEQLI